MKHVFVISLVFFVFFSMEISATNYYPNRLQYQENGQPNYQRNYKRPQNRAMVYNNDFRRPPKNSNLYNYRNHENQSFYKHRNPGYVVQVPNRQIHKSLETPDKIYKNHPRFQNTSKIPLVVLNEHYLPQKYQVKSNSNYNDNRKLLRSRTPYSNDPREPNNDIDEFRGPSKVYKKNDCIRCPAERTSIAAKGKENVKIEEPELESCDGRTVADQAKFVIQYGPQFGSLLGEGSHVILGKIVVNNETMLQWCQLRHNVIVRRCPELQMSSGVIASCPRRGAWGSTCRFHCSNNDGVARIKGPIRIKCKDNLMWSASPPTCEVLQRPIHSWCEMPPRPDFSRLNCESIPGDAPSEGMAEGSICQITCLNRRLPDSSKIDPNLPHLICKDGIWHGDVPYCSRPRHRRHKTQRQIPAERSKLRAYYT